jgi:hypothetical protein
MSNGSLANHVTGQGSVIHSYKMPPAKFAVWDRSFPSIKRLNMKKMILKNKPKNVYQNQSGNAKAIHVRTDFHAGWQCTACEGQAIGNNLIKSKCDYCILG